MTAPTVDVVRWGDWDRPAAADVPAELIAPVEQWMREGGPITDPALAAIIHRKLGQMMRVHVGALDVVDRLRATAQERYRERTAPLSMPIRHSEGYLRGRQLGGVEALDAHLADLMRIRDELSMGEP